MQSEQQQSGGAEAVPGVCAARTGADAAPEAPRLVIRGETCTPDEGANARTAFVDWLGFTIKPEAIDSRAWLDDALESVFCIPRSARLVRPSGWFGYKHRIDLGPYGLIAYGGLSQKGTTHVELSAQGCGLIKDWKLVHEWGTACLATISRVDLAHDDFTGQTVTIEKAVEWYDSGLFKVGNRSPETNVAGDWLGKRKGRTLYIGSREAGKYTRVYEKGKQLGDLDGLLRRWTRVEVELRNKGRIVPWDTLTRPGQYLAGAYPALRFLHADQDRLLTLQRAASISYEAMVKHLRTQGGKAINVMCTVNLGDAAAVIGQLIKEGIPKRLASYPVSVLDNLGADAQ